MKRLIKQIYYFLEDLKDGKLLKRNEALKNIHKGKRCFLIATGSSLKNIDIKKLAKEYTFGCNFLFKHQDHLPFSFYTVLERHSMMRKKARHMPGMKHFEPDYFFQSLESYYGSHKSKMFLHRSNKRYFEQKRLFSNHDIYYVRSSLVSMEDVPILSCDITRPSVFMEGSIFFMISTSIYMGFKELYLCGCGYTYQPLQSGHFYDDWVTLDNGPVNDKHHIMKKFADDHGVEIFNVVPDNFESPVYRKVSWGHVLENVLPTSE